jgi:hypothetical protein
MVEGGREWDHPEWTPALQHLVAALLQQTDHMSVGSWYRMVLMCWGQSLACQTTLEPDTVEGGREWGHPEWTFALQHLIAAKLLQSWWEMDTQSCTQCEYLAIQKC